MILEWLVYLVATTAFVGAAAVLAERALRNRIGSRFIWLAALLVSVGLPFAVHALTQRDAEPALSVVNIAASQSVVLIEPSVATAVRVAEADETIVARAVIIAWTTATVGLWGLLAARLAGFARQRRRWVREQIGESEAYFTHDVGPAVFGLLQPVIVLPPWFHDLSRAHQHAVILHERAHIAARDPQVMLLAFVVAAAMPWNPVLWWQFARLRRAIELDCDQRVLRAVDERDYGEALIAVAERRSQPLRLALSLMRSRSLLERRIAAMSQRNRKTSIVMAGGMVLGSMCLASAAAQVSQPTASILEQARLTQIDAAALDRYSGAYRFSEGTVMWIARKDDHLRVRFTGQAEDDIYPQATNAFFYASPAVDARIEFVSAEEGAVSEAVLRQNGAVTRMPRIEPDAAAQIESTVEQRFSAQSADPHSQAALRAFVESIIAGSIDRNHVNAQLAGALTKDLQKLQVRLASLGKPLSYQFKAVGENGIDQYEVRHERGVSEWGILVDSNDVITSATVPL